MYCIRVNFGGVGSGQSANISGIFHQGHLKAETESQIRNLVFSCIFDAINLPFRAQPFNLGYDNFLGRLAIARVYEGVIKSGSPVFVKKHHGETRQGKITKLFTFEGLQRKEVAEAESGDIVMIAGLPDIYIGETIMQNENQEPLAEIKIDEPTISVNFLVNDSPFAGKEGKFVTGRQIRERLEKEVEINVGLKVDFDSGDMLKVYG